MEDNTVRGNRSKFVSFFCYDKLRNDFVYGVFDNTKDYIIDKRYIPYYLWNDKINKLFENVIRVNKI